MEATKILIVEDETAIAEVEKAYIERDGFNADICADGLTGLAKFTKEKYDLVILDLMLPGMSGVEVCKEIRRNSQVPIIMVTAKSGEDDVVAGLDAGASDYVVKPFSPKVLMARIRANIRKENGASGSAGSLIHVGDAITIDPVNFTVHKNGEEISLTRNEFMIFSKMAEQPDKTWSRDDLITHALGYDYDGFERSIDSYIKNLRKKLSDPQHENGYIKTVHGFGYRVAE